MELARDDINLARHGLKKTEDTINECFKLEQRFKGMKSELDNLRKQTSDFVKQQKLFKQEIDEYKREHDKYTKLIKDYL